MQIDRAERTTVQEAQSNKMQMQHIWNPNNRFPEPRDEHVVTRMQHDETQWWWIQKSIEELKGLIDASSFDPGGLLDYASFVPYPIAMSSGDDAEYNTSAVAAISSLHNSNISNNLDYFGMDHAKDPEYIFPGGHCWTPTPISLNS